MTTCAQLNLFAAPAKPARIDINSVDARTNLKPDDSGRRQAADALAERIVDDRVFSLGITTWKKVIDCALSTGHTEIFKGDDDRPGLRKSGYRYAPLPRLPERAVEYIKGRLLVMGMDALSQKKRSMPMERGDLPAGGSFSVKAGPHGFEIVVRAPGANIPAMLIALGKIPFTDGSQADDAKRIATFLRGQFKAHLQGSDVAIRLGAKDFAAIAAVMAKVSKTLAEAAA